MKKWIKAETAAGITLYVAFLIFMGVMVSWWIPFLAAGFMIGIPGLFYGLYKFYSWLLNDPSEALKESE